MDKCKSENRIPLSRSPFASVPGSQSTTTNFISSKNGAADEDISNCMTFTRWPHSWKNLCEYLKLKTQQVEVLPMINNKMFSSTHTCAVFKIDLKVVDALICF